MEGQGHICTFDLMFLWINVLHRGVLQSVNSIFFISEMRKGKKTKKNSGKVVTYHRKFKRTVTVDVNMTLVCIHRQLVNNVNRTLV